MKSNYGNRLSANEGERQELKFLQDEVQKLRLEIRQAAAKGNKSTASGHNSDASSDSECSGGEVVHELPVTLKANAPGPRMSVSAEVFGKFNLEKEHVPPVHAKSAEQIEAIKQRMSHNFMFSSLNPKDRKAIMDAVVLVKLKAGETVIKEGDDGDSFYLVEDGELTCSKFLNPSDKKETYLKTYMQGESFGELALLYNAPRAATIVAKTNS